MNRKLTRITLLIPIFVITAVLGVAITRKVTSSTFQSPNSIYNSEKMDIQIPGDYLIYEILGTQACECLGNTYSDDTPPMVVVKSPPNNSIISIDTIIYVEASDNYPAIDGGVPFVPEFLYYHWNDTSNATIYNAGVDGAPPDGEPVKVELTLPSNGVGVTHVLYIYAVDYENNWLSVVFVYTTSATSTSTTTTTTTSEPTTTSTITTTTTTTTTSESTTTSTTSTTTTTTTSESTTTSTEITTEETSNTTTESTTLLSSTINLTTGFSTYIIYLLLMILIPIKKLRKNWKK